MPRIKLIPRDRVYYLLRTPFFSSFFFIPFPNAKILLERMSNQLGSSGVRRGLIHNWKSSRSSASGVRRLWSDLGPCLRCFLGNRTSRIEMQGCECDCFISAHVVDSPGLKSSQPVLPNIFPTSRIIRVTLDFLSFAKAIVPPAARLSPINLKIPFVLPAASPSATMLSSLRIATRQSALRRVTAVNLAAARQASTWANVPQGPPVRV